MSQNGEDGTRDPPPLTSAVTAHDLGNFDEAEFWAGEVIAAEPDSPAGYGILASALLELRRYGESIEAARNALARNPAEPAYQEILAAAHIGLDMRTQALENANEAIRLNPGSSRAHLLRSQALRLLASTQEAVREAETAMQLDPGNPACHSNMGDIFLGSKLLTAEKHYRRALELDPKNLRALNGLGTVLVHTSRRARGRRRFKEAYLLDPDDPQTQANLLASFKGIFWNIPRGLTIAVVIIISVVAMAVGFWYLAEFTHLLSTWLDTDVTSEAGRYSRNLGIMLKIILIVYVAYCFNMVRLRMTDPQLYKILMELRIGRRRLNSLSR